MSETRLLEVARQGDPRAISTLLNAVLLPKRVKADVTRQGCTLAVTLHSEKMLNQGAAVTLIRTALEKLHLPDTDQVVIESRVLGAPLWDAEVILRSPAVATAQSLELPSQTIELPAASSSPLPPVADPWQSTPDTPPPAASEAADGSALEMAPSPQDTPEPDAPTLMDLIAAFVESTAPDEPIAPVNAPEPLPEQASNATTAPLEQTATIAGDHALIAEVAEPESADTVVIAPEVSESESVDTLAVAPEVAEPESVDTVVIAPEVPEPESTDTLAVAPEIAEPESVDTVAVAPEVTEPQASASAYPPLGDPWLEADPNPLPEAASSPAIAPETPPEPDTGASATNDTANYTIPTIEKVPRDGQSKVAGIAGMVMGLGFCATGLGTVIGLPMVVGGMWMLGDEDVWRGECPHCRQALKVPVGKLWRFSCPNCQGLIEIKHGRFYARETPTHPTHES
ncbi:hypothetical protein [Parathermosynechococcus lividus]